MPKPRHDSFLISCFLSIFALACFFAILFLALRSPASCQPELHQQLTQIDPVGQTEDGADTIYQKTLPDHRWSQPVCAVTAKRTPYSLYLDGVLLHEYTPGAFDHGGMIHWISLPETGLAGFCRHLEGARENQAGTERGNRESGRVRQGDAATALQEPED